MWSKLGGFQLIFRVRLLVIINITHRSMRSFPSIPQGPLHPQTTHTVFFLSHMPDPNEYFIGPKHNSTIRLCCAGQHYTCKHLHNLQKYNRCQSENSVLFMCKLGNAELSSMHFWVWLQNFLPKIKTAGNC